MTTQPVDAEELAAGALTWLLAQGRPTDGGTMWTNATDDDELTPTLYGGTSGVVLALLEAQRHFGDDRFADAARRASAPLVAASTTWDHSSLYFGTTGIAVALHALGEATGDPAATRAARVALGVVADRFDGERWSDQFELLGGNAGIALGALFVGDHDLAMLAVDPYRRRAEETAHGVHWEVRAGVPARFHHVSHGTLGIVYALAAVGHATGDANYVELACRGAADVVARNEAGPDGFLVPHSDPQHRPELVERYSYGWCHGPAGDAQAFRLLASVTGDATWTHLVDRCARTVETSGVPQRVRPGFWDNNGRCCGTAGVLALALDRDVERGTTSAFTHHLVADLAAHATVDDQGARWHNVEYRASPPALAARTGWAMGNAGIVRELLRYVRLTSGRDPAYAVAWPDQLAVTPTT